MDTVAHSSNICHITVRVPVVLVVVNGDLDTLSHVAKAVQCGISVVVAKGTGGVSDLLAMCIEE